MKSHASLPRSGSRTGSQTTLRLILGLGADELSSRMWTLETSSRRPLGLADPFLSLFGKFGIGYARRVTDELIEQIRSGVAPWQKPWEPGKRFAPENFSTGRRYTAGNGVYLMSRGIKQGFGDSRWGTNRH